MPSGGRRQLFFYGNAISDKLRTQRGIVTDSPAATRKMTGLCCALRTAGVRAAIVSMGRGGGTRSGRFFRAHVSRLNGVPIVYGPVLDVPIVSQLVSAIWLGLYAARLSRHAPTAVHLMYNQMSAYLLALIVLQRRRARVSVDIEDGPIEGNAVAYSRPLGTLKPDYFARYVTGGALLATSALANGTPVRPVLPYFGAVPLRSAEQGAKDFSSDMLIALFAGYLNEDTGLTMLAGAIERMRSSQDPAFSRLVIRIVGMGPGQEILRRLGNEAAPHVEVLGRLDSNAYRRAIESAHIGLSLKPVGGAVSETTFPSKIVEYAENGLALVATDISDVRALFGDAALYIERDDPDELVERFRFALTDRAALAGLAERGRGIVDRQLSYSAAGDMLSGFLFPEQAT